MSIYCQSLNFNVPLFQEHVIIEQLPKIVNGKKSYHSIVDIRSNINPEILKLLSNVSIFPDHCEVFYSEPEFFSGIHVDLGHGDFTKINWIFGGNNSVMNWYSVKDTVRQEKNLSAVQTQYIAYWQKEVELVHSQPLASPSIVQVGVPHNIKNADQPRYCVSLVVSAVKDNKRYRPTMEESIQLLSKYLVP